MTYPRVTEILPSPDFSKVPEHILTNATERGTKVHRIIAAICQGLWVASIPEDCRGYVESFQRWFDEYVEEVIFVEQELIDPIYEFRGHIDFFGKLRKIALYGLTDWKTPIISQESWRLQMAAYNRLLEANGVIVDLVASLQLHPEGKVPKMIRYEGTSASDFNVFLGLLNGFKFLNT